MDFQKLIKDSDIVVGIGALVIFGMLIVPLPGFLLDLLIVFSIGIGLLILLTALSGKEPSDFSIFPAVLLVTTLFRLALNVSTTRQILSKGPAMGSSVIEAFGTFVVGGGGGIGKYVIGFIIFLILIIVQVMVITRGATRIAEVAARFTLDALPGKQMSIDMEFQNGSITLEEAQKKKDRVRRESDFYGAMDGASKFVQGDVRAGLIITFINFLGGVLIGTSIRGESFVGALETYGKFTIGDGLVSQLPALFTTTATGIIVTRAGAINDFRKDIFEQMFKNSRVLYVVSAFLGLGSIVPGLPFVPLLCLAAGLAYLAYTMDRNLKEDIARTGMEESQKADAEKKPDYYKEIQSDPIAVELGLNLLPLVNTGSNSKLLSQISNTRKKFASENGMVIPAVRIMDNVDLDPDSYLIRIHGIIVGDAKIRPTKLMAWSSNSQDLPAIEGEPFKDPAFGMSAFWIDPSLKSEVENLGYSVVDAPTVIVTHLKEIISAHASELLGREEVKALIDHVKQSHPTLVNELEIDKPGPRLGIIQQVLQKLLSEGVAIRNLPTILEGLANNFHRSQNTEELSEVARQAIAKQIVGDYSQNGKLFVYTLEPRVSERLTKSVLEDPLEGRILSLSPDVRNRVVEAFEREIIKSQNEKRIPIFVTSRFLRSPLSHFLSKILPPRMFAVLALEEIQGAKTTIAGTVSISSQDSSNKEEETGARTT